MTSFSAPTAPIPHQKLSGAETPKQPTAAPLPPRRGRGVRQVRIVSLRRNRTAPNLPHPELPPIPHKEPHQMTTRTDILDTAKTYVTKDRAATHGDAENGFAVMGRVMG